MILVKRRWQFVKFALADLFTISKLWFLVGQSLASWYKHDPCISFPSFHDNFIAKMSIGFCYQLGGVYLEFIIKFVQQALISMLNMTWEILLLDNDFL